MSFPNANRGSPDVIPPFPQTYNTLKSDTCDKQYDEQVNDQTYQYNSFLPSVWRPNMSQAQPMMRVSQPNFYGPMTGRRTTMESYLQGRGNILSKCPDAGVNYLPPDLFNDQNLQLNTCTATALEPTYQQYKKACDSISNADIGTLTTGAPKYGQPNVTGLFIQGQTFTNTNIGSQPYKANNAC
jgi:hypothetical protein